MRVRLLTPRALITGTVAPEVSVLTLPVSEGSVGSWSPLRLLDAEIAPATDADATAPRRVGAFDAHGDQLVAILVDEGLDSPRLRPWAGHAHPVPGAFHLGPVVVHGTMRRLNPAVMGRVMPVDDVRVEWAGGSSLRAPLALVNTRWLSGWEGAPGG